MAGPWNANIHYDGRLEACVPASAASVLDVGCGDGFLAARLARRVPLRGSLREALPGARISRLLMGRYLIIWHAPGQGPDRHPQRSG